MQVWVCWQVFSLLGALISWLPLLLPLCLSITDVAYCSRHAQTLKTNQRHVYAKLNDMQRRSVRICMQSADVIPIMQGWMTYPSFSCKAEDMKSVLCRGIRGRKHTSCTGSVWLVLLVDDMEMFLCETIKQPIRNPLLVFPACSSQRIPSLTLSTPALLCKQMFRPPLPILTIFAFRRRYSSARALQKWPKKRRRRKKKRGENPSFPTTEAASLFTSAGRRGGLVSGIWIDTVQGGYSKRPAAVSSTTPVMRCSEQRRRATGMLMARREACWRKNLSQRTLSGRQKTKQEKKTRVGSPFSKLKWLNPRRCPYLRRAPLSAAGGAPPSSCSGLLASRAPLVSSTLH